MALFLDASGQLVVAATMPAGGSTVASAASSNLIDTAPWFRALDDGAGAWHPAIYYASSGESANTITGQLTLVACVLPSDNAGVVSSFALATGTFKVWAGTLDVTTQCAFSTTTLTNITASINASTGVYSATAMPSTSDTGSASFSANYKGQVLLLTFLVTKAKTGATGATGTTGATGATGATGTAAETRRAFLTSAINTGTPSKPTGNITTGYYGLNTWYIGALNTLTSGQVQWQCDGIYNATTNTTAWTEPYQSFLKVDTLAAFTVNTGALTVDATGKIASSTLSNYASANQSGFFLGYDYANYKFKVGSNNASGVLTNGISWDGSTFAIAGDVVASGNIKTGAVSTSNLVLNSATQVTYLTSSEITLARPAQAANAASIPTSILPVYVPYKTERVKTIVIITLQLTHYDSTAGWLVLTMWGGNYAIIDVPVRLTSVSPANNVSYHTLQFMLDVPAYTSTLGDVTITEYNGPSSTQYWSATNREVVAASATVLSLLR